MRALQSVIGFFEFNEKAGYVEEEDIGLGKRAGIELDALYQLLREARNFIANSAPLHDDEKDLFDKISVALPPESGEE